MSSCAADELLREDTITDATERLSMNERTFRRMVARGELEVFYRRGKRGPTARCASPMHAPHDLCASNTDEKSDTPGLVERLRQRLMDGEIAIDEIQLDYPKLRAAFRGRFNGIENVRPNARKERERAEVLRDYLQREQQRRTSADETTVRVAAVDDEAHEQRARERREAGDRAPAKSAERFEKQPREDEQREPELDAQQAETDRRFDHAHELRGQLDVRGVELRKQAEHDGLDAEALEDLLLGDETLNQYETGLNALVPM